MNRLSIITSTTRPGRKGPVVAAWIQEIAREENLFDVTLLDLGEINLPLLDEPNHPRLKKYEHEHTKKWSAMIEESDAFVIVLAEYNFSIPAPIKNAIDYLFHEWRYKPVGIVSYGGMSGGLRSTQMLKQVVTSLNMMPIAEAVALPLFAKSITPENKLAPAEEAVKSAQNMIRQLARWSSALRDVRGEKREVRGER